MKRLIAHFVDRSLVVNAVTVGVCVLGLATFFSMNRDLIPTIQVPIVQIDGSLPGASAIDTEQFLTFPIEEAIADVPGLKKLESDTYAGRFTIKALFKSDHEHLADSLETIRARVDGLLPRLPSDLQPLRIRQLRQDSIDFLDIVFRRVDVHDPEHRKWINSFAERLDKIPHIVKVDSTLDRRDLYIEFDSAAIEAAGVEVDFVRRKVIEYLEYQPVGLIESDFERISVELSKGFDGLPSLENLPILRNRVGRGPNLGDLAQVKLRSVKHNRIEALDGDPFVKLEVWKDTSSDIIRLERRIEDEVAAYAERLPKPMDIEVLVSAAFLIERPLGIILKNGALGLLIVGVILFAFLGFRIAAMAVIGLPFVYFGTLVAMDAAGVGIHLISVIGMLLVLGILVDDAILVSERFLERLMEGLSPKEAAVQAATSLIRPVSGTIITNIVVFMPILFIGGEIAQIFYAIPVVVIATLLLSLIESFLILPNHLKHFVPTDYVFEERRLFIWLSKLYRKVLGLSLRLRYVSMLMFIGLFAVSIKITIDMKKSFNLSLGLNRIYVHGVADAPKDLEDTHARIDALRDALEGLPDAAVQYVMSTAGEARTSGGHTVTGLAHGQLEIVVDQKAEDPVALANEVEAVVTEKLKGRVGFKTLEVHQKKAGPEKDDDVVTIFVSGGDSLSFEEIQAKIRGRLTDLPSVEKLYMDPNRFQRSWRFEPDPNALALYGIEQRVLTRQLREHFAPQELLRMRYRGDQITVFTQYARPDELSIDDLPDLNVLTPRGIGVPLSTLGKWKERSILRRIQHRDRLRKFEIDVRYDADEITKDEIMASLEDHLSPLRDEYPQYTISVKPPEEEEEAKRWITKVVVACLGLIFLTLLVVLNSVAQPFLVMFSIPFGYTGVILALAAHGMELTLMSMIGLIGLAGVVVNDSLVMVHTINTTRDANSDLPYLDVVVKGASTRLKAVLLTSLTTLGGVFPLAYGIGGDAAWTQPMVFALGWGLLFATLLTLFLLPTTLAIFHDVARLLRWALRRGRPTVS